MTRFRQHLPAGNLGRTRLAAMVIGCLALVTDLFQIGNERQPPSWSLAAFLAILLVTLAVLLTHARGRAPWWDSFTLPVLMIVGGAGLTDPLSTVMLALAVTLGLSLYGPTWLWAVRTAGSVVAVPAAVAISPMSLGRSVSWHSTAVLSLLPTLVLINVLMRGIYLALVHQQRAGARDAVLAATGGQMIAVTEVAAVRRLGLAATDRIVALTPGVAMAILRRGPDGLTVASSSGLPAELRGRVVPESVITDPAAFGVGTPGFRHWRVETFSPDLHLLVGGQRRVADDVVAAFRTVANQVVLGEAACRSHAELEHRAHHDQLTGLAGRDKFFAAVRAACATDRPGGVALLIIDLDDFKRVNDTYGHAAGDELLIELAGRIAAAGGPGGVAARFGGDEFALLLTGLDGPDDADAVAVALGARLAAPARLTAATVTVGASIGIAPAGPGLSTGELTRRADLAMYAAKAQGRNRTERYDPARHDDRAPEPLQHA